MTYSILSQNLEDLSSVMNINEVSRGDYLREKSYEDSARVSQIDAIETGDGKDLMSSQNNDELV
jgi:hypothetical protein